MLIIDTSVTFKEMYDLRSRLSGERSPDVKSSLIRRDAPQELAVQEELL
jgi:hypothetical protein